ncbi:MAG TPA: hypothetical protein VG895_03720 [Patescibacteria group bacterium]|nr:hypothetical protein [Patescibacteria group bacterium]
MASLTQTAILTRKIVRYGIYLIIFLIVGRVVLGLLIGVAQNLFPAPPPSPTIAFGKLPSLPFPTNKDIPSLTYTIQTPDGQMPSVATKDWLSQAKVYYMPSERPDLLDLDNTKSLASNMGFSSNQNEITPTIYQFTNPSNPSSIQINIVNQTFSIGYNLNSDSSPLSARPPAAGDAAGTAKNFLNSSIGLPDDLSGPVTQEYLKVQNKQLVSALSLSDANLTKINLFRKDYDDLPAVTQQPGTANVWFIISGDTDQGKQIIGAQYYYYPVDTTQFSTYPLITSDQALKNLQSGQGFVANLGQNQNGKITIRRIYLAYFDPQSPTQFYQPVAVFEGDNGFVAYVPAVTSTYYGQ